MTQLQPFEFAEPGGSRSLRICGFFIGAAAICAIIPFVQNAALYTIVLAMALAAIGPFWADWVRGRLDYFEPVHWIGLVYFVYFGLGSIWSVNNPARVAYDIHLVPFIPLACFYALLGYIAFLVGYYVPFRAGAPAPPRMSRPKGNVFTIATGAAGLAGFVATGWWDVASRLGVSLPIWIATISQLWPLFLFSWALGWVNFYSGKSTRGQHWIMFGGLVPAVMVAGYYTFSDKSLALTLISVPVVARWYMKRKMPWTFLLVLLLVLIFVVFPLYNTFRWFDAGMSRGERVGAAVHTIRGWDSDSYMRYSLEGFTTRLAMVNSLAVIIRDTPQWVPYARGETIFWPIVARFIPRALWPDKPIEQSGRHFGRTFRVTNIFTRATHIGATIPGELYWNFGVPGIILGMALLGSAVRLLYRRYAGLDGVGAVSLAIHIVLLIQWIHIISGVVAGTVVNTLRLLIMLEALRWIGKYTGALTDEDGA